MRRTAAVVLLGAALAAGLLSTLAGARAGGVTRGAATLVGTPPAAGSGWTISETSAAYDFKPRPESKKDNMATYSWDLPSSIPPGGAIGSVSVKASAADTDGIAPGITVSGTMVTCDGIKNAPTPNSGCSDGSAQAALTLQPNQSGSSTQQFKLNGTPSTVTISFGGPQSITYTYTGTYEATTTTAATTTTEATGNCDKYMPKPLRTFQSAGAAHAVQNEVRVVCVEPDVQYHKGGSAPGAWLPVEKDTVLKQGDEITCDPDGLAVLAFADNSTVIVRNTTQLKIASFFTDGGVVRTEILLRMGEVAAQVNKSEATKSDFRINDNGAKHKGSVRGTIFTWSYDPGSHVTDVKVLRGVVEVRATPNGPPTNVVAGKEVELTTKVTRPAPIGMVDKHGGLSRFAARDLVLKTIAKYNGPCGLVTPRGNAFSVKPAGNAWLVSVRAVAGKAKGWSTWTAAGSKVTPKNGAAKKIAAGCG